MLFVERKSMKIRGEKRFYQRVSRPLHVFVLDECKCIYQEGCSFRDVVRLFRFIRFSPARTLLRREWKFNENAGSESRGGEGGGGDKELALNETRSVFYSFNTTPMKGLNFSSRRQFPRKVIMHWCKGKEYETLEGFDVFFVIVKSIE